MKVHQRSWAAGTTRPVAHACASHRKLKVVLCSSKTTNEDCRCVFVFRFVKGGPDGVQTFPPVACAECVHVPRGESAAVTARQGNASEPLARTVRATGLSMLGYLCCMLKRFANGHWARPGVPQWYLLTNASDVLLCLQANLRRYMGSSNTA